MGAFTLSAPFPLGSARVATLGALSERERQLPSDAGEGRSIGAAVAVVGVAGDRRRRRSRGPERLSARWRAPRSGPRAAPAHSHGLRRRRATQVSPWLNRFPGGWGSPMRTRARTGPGRGRRDKADVIFVGARRLRLRAGAGAGRGPAGCAISRQSIGSRRWSQRLPLWDVWRLLIASRGC